MSVLFCLYNGNQINDQQNYVFGYQRSLKYLILFPAEVEWHEGE